MCNTKNIIYSEPLQDLNNSLSINAAIVTAVVNTGQGFSNLEQFSAILDMPCMSNRTYQKYHEYIAKETEKTAWESIELAGKEERRLAIENGDVNDDGIPMITVVADGAWSKRSYKHNYNALSGVVSNLNNINNYFTNVRNYFVSVIILLLVFCLIGLYYRLSYKKSFIYWSTK